MKYLVSVALVYTMLLNAAFGATGSGNVSSVGNFGGGLSSSSVPGFTYPVNAGSSLLSFIFGASSTASAGFYNFWSAGSPATSTAYQVPAGKTLVIFGHYMQGDGSGNRYLFGYGTSAASGGEGGTAPTGPVYYSGSSTTYLMTFNLTSANWAPVPMTFPAGSFPFMKTEGAAAYRGIAIGVLL